MSPEISVIIPAYNTEAYIERAIYSVLNQTIQNLEVVVVDDASTDKTAEIVAQISDERVRLVINAQNLGASASRNRALQAAKGQWIAVLDSDDWYAPERLETLLKISTTQQADMVADDLNFIQDGESEPWSTLISESGQVIENIQIISTVNFIETDVYGKQGLHLGLAKPMFKRNFLIKHGLYYDETVKVTHDFWLYLDCLVKGAHFVFVNQPYYYYVSRIDSLVSGNQVQRLDDDIRTAKKHLQYQDIRQNNQLYQALSKNLKAYQRNITYYKVVEPLKQKQFLIAFREMFRNPYFFVKFISELPKIIALRLNKYLLKNDLAIRSSKYHGWKILEIR